MTSWKSFCWICCAAMIVSCVVSGPSAVAKKSGVADKSKSNSKHGHNGTSACQYTKGPWSECSVTTNTKTRMLTLKKMQDESKCEKTKTIKKKCKKSNACKYEKGAWTKCNADNQMTRTYVLKTENNSSCEKNKVVTKTCKSKSDHNKAQQKRKHSQPPQEQESQTHSKIANKPKK